MLKPIDQQLDVSLEVWDAANEAERLAWLELWRQSPGREVFAHPNYVRLFTPAGASPLCVSLTCERGGVLYPLIRRDLTQERFWTSDSSAACDLVSPYGYGGPLAWGADRAALAALFWPAFDAWAAEQNAVCEFVRFTLFENDLLAYPGEKVIKYPNVVRELDSDEPAIWMDYEHKVRKNVKKALRGGVTVEVDQQGARLEEFLRVYQHTMDRNGAAQSYYFSPFFFEALAEELSGQAVYFHALRQGRVVSSELVLVSGENVYSFLGGTDEAAFDVAPNDLLKHEIIRWAKQQGKRRFVLGGGYKLGDGIYRYKRSFAPEGQLPFQVGRRVLNGGLYQQLVAARARLAERQGEEFLPDAEYFPAYRA